VTDVAGCAPVPGSPAGIARPETVEVRTGLSDESTVQVLEHELGHALGLDHDDAPQPLMAPMAQLTTLPQPDASERALPWQAPELSVYVEYDTASDPTVARTQVGHALDYFERGAGGTAPENVTFVATRNRTAADVVVRFRDRACEHDRGSCARRAGLDPDGDGALEYYTRVEIALVDLDPDAVAWHVAYWLGYAFGFEDRADWPGPLRNASGAERRSEWWADDADPTRTPAGAIGDHPSSGLADDRGLEEGCEESDEGRLLAVGPDGASPRAVRGGFAVGAGEQRFAVDQEDAAEIPIRDGM